MNFADIEAARATWELDEAGMAKLLGLNSAADYTGLSGSDVPSPVASHVETLKMVRSINRGVFNNYLKKTVN